MTDYYLHETKDFKAYQRATQGGDQGLLRYLHKRASRFKRRVARTIDGTLALLATAAVNPLLTIGMSLPKKSDSDEFNASEYNELARRADAGSQPQNVVFQESGSIFAYSTDGTEISSGTAGTDDEAVLLAAINDLPSSGGQVLISPGTYVANLDITRDNVTLVGADRTNTVIQLDEQTGPVLEASGSAGTPRENIHIRNLTFDGQAGSSATWGSETESTTRFRYIDVLTIQDCTFLNTQTRGISVQTTSDNSSDNVEIRGCRFTNNELNAIFVSAENALIAGNIIDDAPDTAIDSSQGSNISVIGNTIKTCNSGILLSDLDQRGVIVGNNVQNSSGGHISVKRGDDSRANTGYIISGNICESKAANTGSVGITTDVRDVHITSNTISEMSNSAIRINGGTNVRVNGNAVTKPYGNVIQVTSDVAAVADLSIENNYLHCLEPGGATRHQGILCPTNEVVIKDNTFFQADPAMKLEQADRAIVQGNVVRESQAAVFLDGCDDCRVYENDLRDVDANSSVVFDGTLAVPTGNVVRNNQIKNDNSIRAQDGASVASQTVQRNDGFTTEAQGKATLLNGSTSISVSPGLQLDPTNEGVQVTPIDPLGSASYWWVTNISASSFDIQVNVDPGQNVRFAWRAEV